MPMAAVAVLKSMSYDGGSTFRAMATTPPGAMAGALGGTRTGTVVGTMAAILKDKLEILNNATKMEEKCF